MLSVSCLCLCAAAGDMPAALWIVTSQGSCLFQESFLKPWAWECSIKLRTATATRPGLGPPVPGRIGAAPLVTDQPPQKTMDEDIRQRLAAGQYHEVFERLVERYSAKVFHLAYSMIGNQTQAED